MDDGSGSAMHGDVASALQAALVAVGENQHPLAVAWRRKVADGLTTLGAPSSVIAK